MDGTTTGQVGETCLRHRVGGGRRAAAVLAAGPGGRCGIRTRSNYAC